MQALLTLAGLGGVALVLVDVFYTVLFPASGHGPLREPLARCLRALFGLTRHLRRADRRQRILSYAGPIQVTVTLTVWFSLLLVAWAAVFRPVLGHSIVAASGQTDASWGTAMYFSGYVLTTLGLGDVVATTPTYRIATVAEAATGFATITLVISYFNSLYTTLTSRNAFAMALHDRSGGTGRGEHIVARLWSEGETAAAGHLAEMAASLRAVTQTHRAYPVLRSFHYRQDFDALPLMLLTCLETSTLLRTTVAPPPDCAGSHRTALHGSAVLELHEAALAMCGQVLGEPPERPAVEEDRRLWRAEHDRLVNHLREAGVPVCSGVGSTDAYVAERELWDAPLAALADALMYDWPQRLRVPPGAPGRRVPRE